MSTPNRLYFGDCLEVMREDIADGTVDLIYLDPPFNSKRLYNAFIGGAQWVAFDDTWRWHEAVDDFHELASDVDIADTMEGLRRILGEGPNLAYLSYMANRLRECKRTLKPTGSIYLHCDPTMSHYLKLVMDAVFGRKMFKNEIVWCYRRMASGRQRHFARCHDTILFCAMSMESKFNADAVRLPYAKSSMKRAGYAKSSLGGGKPKSGICELNERGRFPEDWWEIPIIRPNAKERTGYETQKPLALLRRIVLASSDEGDTVLDPFCGCGTTIEAAEKLGRRWIGIDVCVTACKVIEERICRSLPGLKWSDVEFIGMPKTLDHAKTLASLDAFRFERWAAALVDGMGPNKRQIGDGGIDGRGRLAIRKGEFIDMVSQVKGGSTGPGDVQAFNGARQQAGADMGIFTCFEDRVTPRMRDAAASAGRFMGVPTVQIYTIDDFFEGRKPEIPMAA